MNCWRVLISESTYLLLGGICLRIILLIAAPITDESSHGESERGGELKCC